MASVQNNTIEHFTHPQHPLIKVEAETEYLCDGCKSEAIGSGTRYRCNEGCNFNLHDFCATCPLTLANLMHPHPLTLVVRKPPGTRQINRGCDLCRDSVEGLFYRCKVCNFDVHPLCTKLPQKLQHALHRLHHLQLCKSSHGSCAVCGGGCTSWRYGCLTCNFDIHIQCVLAPPSAHNSVPPNCPPQQPPQYNGNNYAHTHSHAHAHAQRGVVANIGYGSLGKMMFKYLLKLTLGVLSNVIFGGLGF